jgi:putative sterol carrier protein
VAILFDQMRRQADATAVPPGTTIEWAFTDFEPWHLTLRQGGSAASAGHAPHADLVLRTSLQSWADLTAGRVDPLRLLVTRRLRPKGDLRLLPRLGRVFG